MLASDDRLLGTFAIYYHHVGTPSQAQREPIKQATALVALAIERDQDWKALLESEQRYRCLFTQTLTVCSVWI